MSPSPEPIDIEARLADPRTYEDAILRIFAKRSERGSSFNEAGGGVTYFSAAAERRTLSKAIARRVAAGDYRPQPVDLWYLESGGKRRAAHRPCFVDHVIGSALFQLLTHNARCYGLPGVYSYLPGVTNLGAMQTFARYVRTHRERTGPKSPPLYVLQSDFESYGDSLPIGPEAVLWRILKQVASLGSMNGEIAAAPWGLISALVRPEVREHDGTRFTRVNGVAMGTPLVPLVGNLAVVPMDRMITSIDGVFYARYNDDFIVAHPEIATLHEVDYRIDAMLNGLGVKRKPSKDLRTALCATGKSSIEDPAYVGRNRIDCLGLSVSHAGTVSLGPNRLNRLLGRVMRRIDAAGRALLQMPAQERARHLVATTNIMLDETSVFAVAGLSALLQTTTDRGVLKDVDFRIARKIVQVATGHRGVRGFRQIPPVVLYRDMNLTSLVQRRNLR